MSDFYKKKRYTLISFSTIDVKGYEDGFFYIQGLIIDRWHFRIDLVFFQNSFILIILIL